MRHERQGSGNRRPRRFQIGEAIIFLVAVDQSQGVGMIGQTATRLRHSFWPFPAQKKWRLRAAGKIGAAQTGIILGQFVQQSQRLRLR
jgi:hypothetical protein